MKIAIALIANKPALHFGKANDFKIVTSDNDKIIASVDVHDIDHVHQARPQYLKDLGCTILLCNGVGSGAMERLIDCGIEVYGFNNLSVEEALQSFIEGSLPQFSDVFDCSC